MILLKQSTAATVQVGPFIDISDGYTPVTGLSTQAGRIVKNGSAAAFTAASWTEDADGFYLVGLSTTHTNTLGVTQVQITDEATYLPVWLDAQVVTANTYDSLVSGSDYLQTDVLQVEGADATDTIIGADGDTLETLSDQLDLAATAAALATVDTNVDAILVDTSTTLDDKIDTIDTNVDTLITRTAGTITVSSPVASNGDVTIVIGDDYSNDDGLALSWSISNPGSVDLTSASFSLVAKEAAGSGTDWTMGNTYFTATTATGSTLAFRAEPTDTLTATLTEGQWPFQIEATLSGGNIVTLVDGTLYATEDIA